MQWWNKPKRTWRWEQDILAGKGARLLHHLLVIEEEDAQGHKYKADCVRSSDDFHEDHHNALLIKIPYVGTIRITREDANSIPATLQHPQGKQELGAPITVGGIGTLRVSNSILAGSTKSTSRPDSASTPLAEPQLMQPPTNHRHDLIEDLPSALTQDDFFQHQDLYPGLAAGIDEWAFQGVDTAFFENLMQGSKPQFEEGADIGDLGLSWHDNPEGT